MTGLEMMLRLNKSQDSL